MWTPALVVVVAVLAKDVIATSYPSSPVYPAIPADKSTPFQQRLGYHGPTQMAIGWNTFAPLTKPTVHYGFAPNKLWFSASSHSSVTYPTSRTWANSVLIEGLLPATTYYYKIESTNSSIDSFKTGRVAGDHTPFAAALVIDMGNFGEYGLTVNETKAKRAAEGTPVDAYIPPELKHTTIERLVDIASEYEFVLHPGDFAYADTWIGSVQDGFLPGNLSNGVALYEGLSEIFFDQLATVARMKPYMVGVGNHEADCNEDTSNQYLCPIGQTNFTGWINRYANVMPASSQSLIDDLFKREDAWVRDERDAKQVRERRKIKQGTTRAGTERSTTTKSAASLANPPFWYSFDYGMAHIVMFDTETDFGNGLIGPEELNGSSGLNNGPFGTYQNEQIDFLHADLAAVDRKKTPWVVAAGHRPWYTVGGGCTLCQQVFEPILKQYDVDLAVFGHVHNMQRLKPTYNNTVDPAGLNNPSAPWYLVSGAAGQVEGRSSLGNSSLFPEYVDWAYDAAWGFSLIKFLDRQHLEVQFIESDTGAVLDSATLFKKH
ncbi:Metallo-dependent phosphatase [Clavulina sp. PMI_390]|nr:Metallo-dependent phosphatase [Clavulina sp. PMI_390]